MTLSNKTAWALFYRDQFGIDIVPTLMPLLSAMFALLGEITSMAEKQGGLEYSDVMELLESDSMAEALIKLSGIEFVDLINLTWALAKAADPNIPEPKIWILGFEQFPLDLIVPTVSELIVKGMVSTKKAKWLQEKLNNLKVYLQSKSKMSEE